MFCLLGIVILKKRKKHQKTDIIEKFIINSEKEEIHINRIVSNQEYSDILISGMNLINKDDTKVKLSSNIPETMSNIYLPEYCEI